MAKRLTREGVTARLTRLRMKPVENAGIIKKWERKERRLNEK